jgi:Ni/Fe-hydrogenase subunit HybB-like protein
MSTITATPASPARPMHPFLVLLAILGIVAFLYGIAQGAPARVWGIYLVNLLFWSSLAITGPAVAGMIQVTEGRWSPSIKRVALTTAGFLPISFILFLVLFLGRATLYPWVTEPIPIKAVWLNVPFMALRIGLGSLLLYWVAMRLVKAILIEDQPGQDTQTAIDRRYRLASVLLVLYVVVLSLWGFDLLMSLDPRWYSGLFGGYYVVTSMYPGFGLVTYLTIRSNERGITHVSPSAIQDVAKLTFALAVFWMYFFFSQYLVIWYGNMPVETRYLARRFFNQPWGGIAWAIFIVGWLIPFSYLLKRLTGRPPERHQVFKVILFLGWIAIFFERMLLVFPALLRDNTVPIGPVEVLVTLGFFALFVLSRNWFLARYRPILDLPK